MESLHRTRCGRKRSLAQIETPDTSARAGAVTRRSRTPAASRPAIIRYTGRHLGFLAGLLIVAVAIGVAYRYLFDPLEERTLPFYIRSCTHAMGLTFAGWAVHLTFAAAPRSRLGSVLRRLPLSVEFVIKALTMPQTPAKGRTVEGERVRGGAARARAISLVQRSRVSRAWRTTFPTVLSSRKRSRLGRAV